VPSDFSFDVLVAGGGASGFFAAIEAARNGRRVLIVEKSSKTLAKVRASGGGRCNVTHASPSLQHLTEQYPRGGKELEPLFKRFGVKDTLTWFLKLGVQMHTEPDGRMFPTTNSAETIAGALEREAARLGIKTLYGCAFEGITLGELPATKNQYCYAAQLRHSSGEIESVPVKAIVLAMGGQPKATQLEWLARLGVDTVPPVQSLFSFNIPSAAPLHALSVSDGQVSLPGTGLTATGPLLITHWGISGPAVLRLSAFAARQLHQHEYKQKVEVNWLGAPEKEVLTWFSAQRSNSERKRLATLGPRELPQRLWLHILAEAALPQTMPLAEAGKKHLATLASKLAKTSLEVEGKTTYKDEFVTAGGIALHEIDLATMQLKKLPGIFACGELCDIDGVTGGFNFQAAWSAGYVVGQSV
jgi:predicted Rossmann fold flavoprotein